MLRLSDRDTLERRAKMKTTVIAVAAAGLLATACTATGNTERNAAGAVIGNNVGGGDAGTGAAIGAAIGGTAGAIKGCREDGGCGATNVNRRQYYDERAGRYYYYDSRSGRYFWEDGSPR
jgi:Glycine zipper